MAKKDLNEEKIFKEKCKMYLGSVSARAISFAYFNLANDLVVLCNSTTPPPNKIHGDRLMDYSVSELSFHFLYFKDREFLEKLRLILQIPDGVYYCINVILVLSIFSHYKLSELEVYDNEFGDKVLNVKTRSTYDKKNVIGFPIYDIHVLNELYKWIRNIENIGTEEHKLSHPNTETSIDLNTTMHGRVYFNEFQLSYFKDRYDQEVFTHMQPSIRIVCLDGLSSPSLKQFIKKLPDDSYKFYQYLWVEVDTYILSMTIFENDIVTIKSIRPNLISLPISDNIKLKISTNPLEESYGNS